MMQTYQQCGEEAIYLFVASTSALYKNHLTLLATSFCMKDQYCSKL